MGIVILLAILAGIIVLSIPLGADSRHLTDRSPSPRNLLSR